MFSSDANTSEKLKDDPAMIVRVTDMSNQPLAGAKVIVDAERSNFRKMGRPATKAK